LIIAINGVFVKAHSSTIQGYCIYFPKSTVNM
jgi:hypothetical protein